MTVRKRILHGWYPWSKEECKKVIEKFIQESKEDTKTYVGGECGGIVPHAGWFFSGKLAAKVFYLLSLEKKPDLVVIYGGHLALDLPKIITEDKWDTPLGEIEIDKKLVTKLLEEGLWDKEILNSLDNTIEVNLPFVKYFFPESKLLAIRSPHSEKAIEVGMKVAKLAKEENYSILALGSTDLTHYGPSYGFYSEELGENAVSWVKENDRKFIEHAIDMDYENILKVALENNNACSAGAATSAIVTCKEMGSKKGFLVDYYTSYDITHEHENFVGYAGIIF